MTTTEGPAAAGVARVPRSRVDELFVRGDPLPPVRIGTGTVVSIEGDTCTVDMFDEEITGVVWLGANPPAVGSTVEVEARGDLLVITKAAIDTFEEGAEVEAVHIVSDVDPGSPAPSDVNIGGSMRDPNLWEFGADAHGWRRELTTAGAFRVWQEVGTVQSTNLIPNPSFETGLTGWSSPGGMYAPATLSNDPTRGMYGSHSMLVEWPAPVGFNGSGAVIGKVPMDPAKRYILSLHLFIPSGSPDVRATAAFSGEGPLVTDREQWVWTEFEFSPPADGLGDYVGVHTMEPHAGGMCWVDAVCLRESTEPLPPGTTYFDGSIPPQADATYVWTGTAHASTSQWYDGQTGAPGVGTLWSTETFDVTPGDTLDYAAIASKNAGSDATMQLVVCYGTDDTSEVDVTTDEVVVYGSPVAVSGPDIEAGQTIVVPDTLPVSGGVPAVARVGIRFNGPASSDMNIDGVYLTQTLGEWPLGSLWLNPAAGNALPTYGVTATGATSGGQLASATNPTRAVNAKKALVTAPIDAGGMVLAFSTGGVTSPNTNNVALELQHFADGASAGPMCRLNLAGMNATAQLPFTVVSVTAIAPGQTVEIVLMYNYTTAPGSTVNALRGHTMTVMFLPLGVSAGTAAQPAAQSYWDGDSWREGLLDPAVMDLTKDGTVVEPAKTPTTTALTVPTGPFEPGDTITLSSSVSPTAADGTVTFYRGTSATGPWTSIGAVTLDAANKAVKTWQATAGSWYFRARYGGSTTHAASEQVSGQRTVSNPVTTKTKTVGADWVMPYNGSGSQKGGGSYAGDTYTGYFDGQTGNQKSMIRFIPNLPGDADVTKVELICDDWDFWRTNQGGLVVGWHENKGGSAPNSWNNTHASQSEHSPGEGKFTVTITSWADTKVGRSDFGGITIGPGKSNGDLYNGNCLGKSNWHLRITYKTAT